MTPEIVRLDERTVIGVRMPFDAQFADYRALWAQAYLPRRDELAVLAMEPDHYGVLYSNGAGQVDFLMGVIAAGSASPPQGMEKSTLPGGIYARFDTSVAAAADAWHDVYTYWMPNSVYSEDDTRPSIEVFPGTSVPGIGNMTVYMPVTPAI